MVHCLWEPSMECCLWIIGPSAVCSHVVPTPPIIILFTWPNGEFRQVLGDCENKMYSSVYQRQTRIWGQKRTVIVIWSLKVPSKVLFGSSMSWTSLKKTGNCDYYFLTKCFSLGFFFFSPFHLASNWDDHNSFNAFTSQPSFSSSKMVWV